MRRRLVRNKTLLIIPAYNEEETIRELVERGKKYVDVCVIDDHSSDKTPHILRDITGIHIITHEVNTHIPGAVLDGMQYAVVQNYDYAITMDAGLSHNPDEIPGFLDAPDCDLVIGVRTQKLKTPLYRKILSFSGNLIYNISLDFPRSLFKKKYYRDITSGFRRYSQKAMKNIIKYPMESRSFDFLVESTAVVYRNRLKICEVPITYRFTNSSLRPKVVKDCLRMCLKLILQKKA